MGSNYQFGDLQVIGKQGDSQLKGPDSRKQKVERDEKGLGAVRV
jgi:hypothetical protein